MVSLLGRSGFAVSSVVDTSMSGAADLRMLAHRHIHAVGSTAHAHAAHDVITASRRVVFSASRTELQSESKIDLASTAAAVHLTSGITRTVAGDNLQLVGSDLRVLASAGIAMDAGGSVAMRGGIFGLTSQHDAIVETTAGGTNVYAYGAKVSLHAPYWQFSYGCCCGCQFAHASSLPL